MPLHKAVSLIGLAMGVMLACAGVSQAETAEEFYKDKTVTIVVSAPPGTESDNIARVFVNFFKKHFPGSPKVIVQNKPGAAGLVAAGQLQKTEPKDGTVITLLQRNNFYTPLVTGKQDAFDPREVTWVGSIDSGNYPHAIVVFENSPVQSAAEMFTKTMVMGASGFDSENRTIPAMMNLFFGTKFNIVSGYSGRGDIYLAMERGEVNGYFQGVNSLHSPAGGAQYFNEGRLKPIVIIGHERYSEFPDLPALVEFAKNDEQLAVIKFFLRPIQAGRPFAIPKGVPADRVAAIRQAFAETFKDREALEQMAKMLDNPVKLITGPELEGIIADVYGVSDRTLEGVRKILVKK